MTNGQNAVVVYHSVDMDGWTSAWVIHKYLNEHLGIENKNIFDFGYNYNTDLSKLEEWLSINLQSDTYIYMADVTLPDTFMSRYAENIIWLDHHKSAIDRSYNQEWRHRLHKCYANTSRPVGDGAVQTASCWLCWSTFFKTFPPRFLVLANNYDIWDLTNKDTMYFQVWVRNVLCIDLIDKFPALFLQPQFKQLESSDCEEEIKKGMEIYIWKERLENVECLTQAKKMYISTVPVAVINRRGINSDFFKAICKKHGDIQCCISFGYDFMAGSWVVSFYDAMDSKGNYRKNDVLSLMTKICEQADPKTLISYGGHKSACGMNTYDIRNDFLNHLNRKP